MASGARARPYRGRAALPAGIGIALSAGALLVAGERMLLPYLAAYLFWIGVSVGSLGVLMVHHLTGGAWGQTLRVPLLRATRMLPVLAVLIVPLLLFPQHLYPWVEGGSPDAAWYLNRPFFTGRAIVYLVAWLALAWGLNAWGASRPHDPARARRLSAGGLVVLLITVSLAAFDWAMSLDPKWYSAVFGLVVALSFGTAAMAGAVLWAAATTGRDAAAAARRHDLGNLLLAFVMLWAYLAFMQFLTVWIGNLPHEARWYLPRLNTSWAWLGLTVVVLQIVVPAPVLFSGEAKRGGWSLALGAASIFVAQALYALWLTFPTVRPSGYDLGWADAAMFLGIGGIALGAWLWPGRAVEADTHPPAAWEAHPHA